MDTGATDHITSDMERLTVRDKYHGADQVHAANGSSMEITHVGHSLLRSPISNIHLKNILHVPKANKNLLFVHRLTSDNGVFLEFHPNHLSIKEETRSSSEAGVKEASIRYDHPRISRPRISKLSALLGRPLPCGTIG